MGEGTDDSNRLYIQFSKDQSFIPVIEELEASYIFLGNKGSDLWFFTNKNAPNGKIVKLKINKNESFLWEDVINEITLPISGFSLINNKFVIEYLKDSQSKVSFFNLEGEFISGLDLPSKGSVSGFNGKISDRYTYFSFTNYVTPTKIYKMDMETLILSLIHI